MRDILLRLRAALSPQALAALVLALLCFGFGGFSDLLSGKTALEKRIEDTLSMIKGAGRVSVVILTAQEGGGAGGEIPVGVCAVAQGADDPMVRLNLQEALCTLLGLPASSVTVMEGGE